MKIGISAAGSTLGSNVAGRLGTADYMIIVDLDSGDVEAILNPGNGQQRGAGLQAIMLAVNNGAGVVLTGYVNPVISRQFEGSDIQIITGISGTVEETVQRFKENLPGGTDTGKDRTSIGISAGESRKYINSAGSAFRQLANMLPIMIGIVMLIGLFNVFISKKMLAGFFSGSSLTDSFLGACLGSLFIGNPINSYIVGGELLKNGVGLTAVTAFVIAWVTVGLVQLPAEIAALGRRFAFLRNLFSFILSLVVAYLTVWILNLVGGIS